ncbi:MAG: hypothetical protein PHO48_00395 [Candidatus Gracilibacteria bacterium]|nr:hypothetical protein [Candidatus Gracilibacteria bacterium]MDD5178725.1 hypothetical protein [Candidatus Gracilibacteria bacterium]
MEDPGEHLVGQYLKEIKKCDFVEYNLQTGKKQGEIDVVGIDSVNNIVYVCEVATHLDGLHYNKNGKPDNVRRFLAKFEKDIDYIQANFKEYKRIFMLWTPVAKNSKKGSKHNQIEDLKMIQEKIRKSKNIEIDIIKNNEYYKCLQELRGVAAKTKNPMNSPIMRFLQIEERLKKNSKRDIYL